MPAMSHRRLQRLIAKANDGDQEARLHLAVEYATGDALPQDLFEARRWYLAAAESGHAYAAFNLASMLLAGEGGAVSRVQGRRWLRRAAAMGSTDALVLLADLLRHGAPEDGKSLLAATRHRATAFGLGDMRGLRDFLADIEAMDARARRAKCIGAFMEAWMATRDYDGSR